MVQVDEVKGWIDRTVVDPSGHKIGTVSEIFIDDETNRPEWASVHAGLLGGRSSFVPIGSLREEGEALVVPWDRAHVKDAPQPGDVGDGHLSAADEVRLYQHYQRDMETGADVDRDGEEREADSDPRADRDDGADGEVTSGEGDAVSGEGAQPRRRTYVVTEEVHPVSRVLMDDSPVDEATDAASDRSAARPGQEA